MGRWTCPAHPDIEMRDTADVIDHERRNADCKCRLARTESDLRVSCNALLAANPTVKDQGVGDGDRPLASFTRDAEGWCGFVEEVVTTWLTECGWDAKPIEVGSGGRVAFFGVHYLTKVNVEGTDYAVDFTASQIPGAHDVPFPVIGPLAEYLEWYGLVAS